MLHVRHQSSIDTPLSTGCRLRPAERDDLSPLMSICTSSFPTSLRWRVGGEPARRWWAFALDSEACEVWVAVRGQTVMGFVVLIVDERRWRESDFSRDSSIVKRLAAGASHPTLAAAVAAARLRRGAHTRVEDALDSNPPVPAERRTWIELIAVDPQFQGQGVGAELIRHAERRTRSLRRIAVQLSVDGRNRQALQRYVRSGFGFVRRSGDDIVLAKRLAGAS